MLHQTYGAGDVIGLTQKLGTTQGNVHIIHIRFDSGEIREQDLKVLVSLGLLKKSNQP